MLGSCAALDLELPGTARMLETARLKATHATALADCFAVPARPALRCSRDGHGKLAVLKLGSRGPSR